MSTDRQDITTALRQLRTLRREVARIEAAATPPPYELVKLREAPERMAECEHIIAGADRDLLADILRHCPELDPSRPVSPAHDSLAATLRALREEREFRDVHYPRLVAAVRATLDDTHRYTVTGPAVIARCEAVIKRAPKAILADVLDCFPRLDPKRSVA